MTDAVDLAHAATLEEWADKAPRIKDVVKTIDETTAAITQAMVEYVTKKVTGLERKITALDAKVERIPTLELENANLHTEIAELKREIAAVDHKVELRTPTKRATAKPKPNGGTKSRDAATLPQ
jgi:peptidoglycan hydrolase CwlO-like protein